LSDIYGVIERRVFTPGVYDPEEMPVQIHRVMHHGAVDYDEPYNFTAFDFTMIGL
jgi:hypothetical protein